MRGEREEARWREGGRAGGKGGGVRGGGWRNRRKKQCPVLFTLHRHCCSYQHSPELSSSLPSTPLLLSPLPSLPSPPLSLSPPSLLSQLVLAKWRGNEGD